MKIQPVILSGGAGSRLWPLSRLDKPKQFSSLAGNLTTYQEAVSRLTGEGVAPPIVVSSPEYQSLILEQSRAVGVTPELILEPEARDSAPAIAAAAAYVGERYPDRALVIQPADHRILDREAYLRSVANAVAAAQRGVIVTFGIRPTFPSTAYGYIKPGARVEGMEDVDWIEQFVEKPDLQLAETYLREGYVWNSGIFVFTAAVFERELRLAANDLAAAVNEAVRAAHREKDSLLLDAAAFRAAPKLSIDYALMEHTRAAVVVQASYDWSDLGTWPSLKKIAPGDKDGNVLAGGNAFAVDSRNCLVRSSAMPVMVVGGQDLSVIVEPDAVLVCSDHAAEKMKSALGVLKAARRPELVRSSASVLRPCPSASLPDAAWRLSEWLMLHALPLWSAFGIDYQGFGFFEALDSRARPTAAPRRFRVQPRQLYVFAKAGELGWPGPWPTATMHGLQAMLKVFRRPDGLFRTLVDGSGAPLDESATLYDQAFALFGLATVAKSDPSLQTEMESYALLCLDNIQSGYRLPKGIYGEIHDRRSRLQSNPLMHLLEAALLWDEIGSSSRWHMLADEIVAAAIKYFIDPEGGFLREHVDEDVPLTDSLGRLLEPGHQFEWAYLLTRWVARGGDDSVLSTAQGMYEIARTHGWDPERGVVMDALNDDLTIRSSQARLWPQSEYLKAALSLARGAGPGERRQRLEADALAAADGLAQYFDMPVAGLWRDKMRENGTFVVESVPASSFYHIVGAIADLISYVREG